MNSMVIFHRFLQRLPGRVTGESKLMELVDETAVWVSKHGSIGSQCQGKNKDWDLDGDF